VTAAHSSMTDPMQRRAATDLRWGRSSSLAWLRGILWAVEPSSSVASDLANDTIAVSRDWYVLSLGPSTLLVPNDRRAGARSLLQFNDSMTQGGRSAKAAMAIALRMGLAQVFLRHRFSVSVIDAGRDLIESELPRLLGVRRVEVSIFAGRGQRPNVKPVLQVMDVEGRILAFAKLGWNPLTTSLVDNETMVLRMLARKATTSFRAPTVLHAGQWNGLRLVLLTPLRHRYLRSRGVESSPPLHVLEEVAAIGPIRRERLVTGQYWLELTERAASAAGPIGNSDEDEGVFSRLGRRLSDARVVTCMSHGDFAPWNMIHADGGLNVWDWERAYASRPLGFDALHFNFEVAYQKQRLGPAEAIASAMARSRPAFQALRVSAEEAEAVREVYLLERLTRTAEGRRAGVQVDDRLLTWLIDRLRDRTRTGGVV
jgi:hypothetical protein